MAILLEETSTITAKGQTTVPKSVRQALGVDYGGRISFRVDAQGVTLVRADDAEDPALEHFLDFLATDITARPEAVKTLSPGLLQRISDLTKHVADDVDAEIVGDVSL
jgi:antitoxin PrlF